MKKLILSVIITAIIAPSATAAKKAKSGKAVNNAAIKYLDDNFWTYDKLQKTIWANPELGFIEYNSSKLLQDHLRENG